MPGPTWITQELVLAIHKRQLAEHGGIEGVRDEGLLSSALARPRHLLAYAEKSPRITVLAASYGHGIAQNHPFLDGNKRTAYVVCRTFLLLNGHDINTSQEDKYLTFLQLAEGTLSEEELADWLHSHLEKVDYGRLSSP